MQFFGRDLATEEVMDVVKRISNDTDYKNCGKSSCLMTQAASELAAELSHIPRHVFLVGASNMDTNISVRPFPTEKDARQEMLAQMASHPIYKKGQPRKIIMPDKGILEYNGERYWWNIIPIEG